MRYKVNDGVYFLGPEITEVETLLFESFKEIIVPQGFQELRIPSTVSKETYLRQDIISPDKVFRINDEQHLTGSAEQGILEYFTNEWVEPALYYSTNQCFRNEKTYEGLYRVKEFVKLEQFCFSSEDMWGSYFGLLLDNAIEFLESFNLKYRVVNMSKIDPGYHKLKYDIEVKTKQYGWMETHSCSYFGEEQSRRFGIQGATHTISNTGVASPRILIPFLEDPDVIRELFTLNKVHV